MNIWQAIILSIVEGVTEFLPISSTAHLELTAQILRLTQTDFIKSFEIIIQLGAIASVAILYFKKILKDPSLIWKILIAFLPTGVLGLVFYKLIKNYLLGNSWVAIVTMFVGGLFLLKFKINKPIQKLSIPKLLTIGLFQSLAMIPGVSRALVTIWGGEWVGLSRSDAVEMSFLLAVPTMAAATGLDLLKMGFSFSRQEWFVLAVGFMGAFLSALLVVKWLIKFVQTHDFKIFGWYRIALALLWGTLIISQRLP